MGVWESESLGVWELESLRIAAQASDTKHQTPAAEHQAPGSRRQSVCTKHEEPSTRHRAPSANRRAHKVIGKNIDITKHDVNSILVCVVVGKSFFHMGISGRIIS